MAPILAQWPTFASNPSRQVGFRSRAGNLGKQGKRLTRKGSDWIRELREKHRGGQKNEYQDFRLGLGGGRRYNFPRLVWGLVIPE